MPLTDAELVLPALSLTLAVAPRSLPSPVMTVLAGQAPSMPESASEQAQSIVTSPLYQPLALAAVVGAPEIVGFVRSILTGLLSALVVLSAASVAVPCAVWLAPSVAITELPGQSAMPESASAHVH